MFKRVGIGFISAALVYALAPAASAEAAPAFKTSAGRTCALAVSLVPKSGVAVRAFDYGLEMRCSGGQGAPYLFGGLSYANTTVNVVDLPGQTGVTVLCQEQSCSFKGRASGVQGFSYRAYASIELIVPQGERWTRFPAGCELARDPDNPQGETGDAQLFCSLFSNNVKL